MAHLYVIAGHGAGDPGACAHGASEAERVRALAQRIKDLGGDGVTLHSFDDDAYQSAALEWLDIPSDWCVVELHMDSAGAGARGGHVIIQDGLTPDSYDNALSDLMARIFPGRSTLIVGRNDLANPSRAANRGVNYRLVENGFISDAGDLATFNGRIDDIARGYLAAFGIGSAPAVVDTPHQEAGKAVNNVGFVYRAHVKNLGWCDSVRDGQQAGTTGYGLQLEAIKITPPEGLELDVKFHVQNVGWKTYKGIKRGESSGTGSSDNDPIIGTVGKSLRAEALEVVMTKNTTGKTLYYRVHLADVGWTGWVEAGYTAGTVGIGKQIEAVQFKLV